MKTYLESNTKLEWLNNDIKLVKYLKLFYENHWFWRSNIYVMLFFVVVSLLVIIFMSIKVSPSLHYFQSYNIQLTKEITIDTIQNYIWSGKLSAEAIQYYNTFKFWTQQPFEIIKSIAYLFFLIFTGLTFVFIIISFLSSLFSDDTDSFLPSKKSIDTFCKIYRQFIMTPQYLLSSYWWNDQVIQNLMNIKNILILWYELNQSKNKTFDVKYLQQYNITPILYVNTNNNIMNVQQLKTMFDQSIETIQQSYQDIYFYQNTDLDHLTDLYEQQKNNQFYQDKNQQLLQVINARQALIDQQDESTGILKYKQKVREEFKDIINIVKSNKKIEDNMNNLIEVVQFFNKVKV